MEQTPTPITNAVWTALARHALKLERERAMLREALDQIMHYAGIGASVCDVDVTEQPQFVKAREALEATKEPK